MDRIPDVSVIVAVFNGMPHVERAHRSLAEQTIGLARMQVLVVDDGSTDGTPAFIDRFAARHPSFETFHQENSGGPAAPRNFALERVRGRYIFFLDADDYLSDDALRAMVSAGDDNGTDVVLARVKGVGGRGTPRVPFARTIPRTDVFESDAYWILNPMKMFRTVMVRSLGLRFPTDIPWGEDQSFTATAYLKGNGISILADKDYVFWVFLDDRSNMTTRVVSLAERMPVVDLMFDLVADAVPEGPGRDRLMRRHFQVELADSAFEGYRTETDDGLRRGAFVRFRTIADSYYHPGIEAGLQPRARVLMWLVSEGRAAEFAAFLDVFSHTAPAEALIEGGSIFVQLPGFRDPAAGLPDRLFDVAPGLRSLCRVERTAAVRGGLRFSVTCRLGELTHRVTDVSLVARSQADAREVVVPLAHRIVNDERRPYVVAEDTVAPSRLPAGLSAGTYGLFVRVSAGDVSRESRIRECAPAPSFARVTRRWALPMRFGTLTTNAQGQLSMKVVVGTRASLRSRVGRLCARARVFARGRKAQGR